METYNIEADENWKGKRVDKSLADYFDDYSRSFLKKLLDDGNVLVNDKKAKPSLKIASGDKIDITIPDILPVEIEPEDIPLDIVYEDDDIIIVNKPKGMVVHPAPGHYSGTLVNGLMYHFKDSLSGINGELRPGIVHRIDMDTTGLLVVCKNDAAHNFLSEQLAVHSITRKYYAICYNYFTEDEGMVDLPIGRHPTDRKKMAVVKENGRDAVTEYEVVERFGKYTLVRCKLRTGRTHQIRVHMEYLGYPLVGDPKYSPMKTPFAIQGQALHSQTLEFTHPRTGERMRFEAALPEDMQKIVTRLHLGQFN